MLQISNPTYRYPGTPAVQLSIATLSLDAGERAIVIGPSGCGKSTLLHLVAAILTPQQGDLRMAVGMAMMTFVISASPQLEESALRDAWGIDLVVGAKGSPPQLILSSIYHIDVPTGNIPLAAQAQLAQNRMVKKVIPLALGDSDNDFRIVGTVLDRPILPPVASVWHAHQTVHGAAVDENEEKPAMDAGRELTALLVQYATPLAAVSMPRFINSHNALQAAQPAFEAAKLFHLLGVGVDVLRGVAAMALPSATLSMFVALYNALEERKTDLAILRTFGAPPAKLLFIAD